jgi:hypothetical protein
METTTRLSALEVLDGPLDLAANNHCPRLSADFVQSQHLLMEMTAIISAFNPMAQSWFSTYRRSFFFDFFLSKRGSSSIVFIRP